MEKAHSLTLAVYKATAAFPREEMYGITAQMRRCSGSIPANIAEGCGRNSDADFARLLQIAMGTASELEYHLLLAHDPSFLVAPEYERLTGNTVEIKRMLSVLMARLRNGRATRDGPTMYAKLMADS